MASEPVEINLHRLIRRRLQALGQAALDDFLRELEQPTEQRILLVVDVKILEVPEEA